MDLISALINDTLEAEFTKLGAPPAEDKFPGATAFIQAKENDATDSLAILLSHVALIDRHGIAKFAAHERAIQS